MKTGIELIAEERQEQINKHGRSIQRDIAENDNQQLATAAEMLLAEEHEEWIDSDEFPYGWDKDICRHMLSKPYKERLIIAGALIAAEIDRISENPDAPLQNESRRIVNTYIAELDGDHWTGNEVVKLHELANGEWYLEDWKGRLVTFSTERALKLINAPA